MRMSILTLNSFIIYCTIFSTLIIEKSNQGRLHSLFKNHNAEISSNISFWFLKTNVSLTNIKELVINSESNCINIFDSIGYLEVDHNCSDFNTIELNSSFYCSNNIISIGPYVSKVCDGIVCDYIKGEMNHNLTEIITINSTIFLTCYIKSFCSSKYYFLDINCLHWYEDVLIISIFSIVYIIVWILIHLMYKMIRQFSIHRYTSITNKNSRIKHVRGKKRIIQNSRAPNKTNKKKTSSFAMSFLLINLFTLQGCFCCNNILSYSSSEEICFKDLSNSNCTNTYLSEAFFSDFDDELCISHQPAISNYLKIKLVKIETSCEDQIEYYTPLYKPDLSMEWRCSSTDACQDGIFLKNSSKLHIDIPKAKTPFDGCFYTTDECIRITVNLMPLSKSNFCTVKKCIEFKYKYILTIGSDYLTTVSLSAGETFKYRGITFQVLQLDKHFILQKYVDCGNFFYLKEANTRNIFNPHEFGIIQCETAEAAKIIDVTKCHLNLKSQISYSDLKPSFLNSDSIDENLKLPTTTKLENLFSVTGFYGIRMRIFSNTSLTTYLDAYINQINTFKVSGNYGDFNKAKLAYFCNIKDIKFSLNCYPFFISPVTCSMVGDNLMLITTSGYAMPPSYTCKLSNTIGTKSIIISTNLTSPDIIINDETYVINFTDLTPSGGVTWSLLSNLFLEYILNYYKILLPIAIIIGILYVKALIT